MVLLRRSLHDLLLVATRSRSEVSHINIVILLQLFQTGQDSLLDNVLALGGWGSGLSRLLDLSQRLVRRQTAQGIDEDGIRLGNVEADVRDLVCHQSIQNGKNGAVNDIECNNGRESLEVLAYTGLHGPERNSLKWQSMLSCGRGSWGAVPWPSPWG